MEEKLDKFLNLNSSSRRMKSSRKQKTPSKSSRLMANYYWAFIYYNALKLFLQIWYSLSNLFIVINIRSYLIIIGR
jgi:hypothetical protein